jgi:hypothetical protein
MHLHSWRYRRSAVNGEFGGFTHAHGSRVLGKLREGAILLSESTPGNAGSSRAGRAELLATPFETSERNVREQLGRTLAGGGFDPARDITAITVNRWPHGFASEFNPLL